MTESPVSYQGRQDGPSGQGQPQNPTVAQSQAPARSQDQPIDVEQEGPLPQQRQRPTQQKAALAQAAAKLAQDAASMAGQAAEMARQAAEMAARATDLPWDGPCTPVIQPFFNMAPGYGSPNQTLIPPQQRQQPQHIDQPMENYQSEFPVAERSKRKRKSRASEQEAGGSGSPPAVAIAPNPVVQPGGKDYQQQLLHLEQQNKKRLLTRAAERQHQSGEGSGSRPVAMAIAPLLSSSVAVENLSPHGLVDYQYQLMLLEQANKKRAEEKARQQQQQQQKNGEGSGSGGA
jgi:hypothetical protein